MVQSHPRVSFQRLVVRSSLQKSDSSHSDGIFVGQDLLWLVLWHIRGQLHKLPACSSPVEGHVRLLVAYG